MPVRGYTRSLDHLQDRLDHFYSLFIKHPDLTTNFIRSFHAKRQTHHTSTRHPPPSTRTHVLHPLRTRPVSFRILLCCSPVQYAHTKKRTPLVSVPPIQTQLTHSVCSYCPLFSDLVQAAYSHGSADLARIVSTQSRDPLTTSSSLSTPLSSPPWVPVSIFIVDAWTITSITSLPSPIRPWTPSPSPCTVDHLYILHRRKRLSMLSIE